MDHKQRVRERVWAAIDGATAARRAPGAHGRIPNYAGAEDAARRLWELPEWQRAKVLKMNPDSPQLALRARAIADAKLVYMAVPKLTSEAPFLALEQRRLEVSAGEAASIEGATRYGVPTSLADMVAIDFIVCGSVAVNELGARIGKGGGYADLEYALLAELGLVTDRTLIATTVHDLQLTSEGLPESPHDFRVDIIVTPTRVLRCPRAARPQGIAWQDLAPEKIASIPVLQERFARQR